MSDLRIRIDAADVPGLTCSPRASGDGSVQTYGNIRVAVQRRARLDEVLDIQPGDSASATWTLPCASAATPRHRCRPPSPAVSRVPGGR
jgi:hypothetical protein